MSRNAFVQLLPLILSTIVTIILSYSNLEPRQLQQIVIVLLEVLIILVFLVRTPIVAPLTLHKSKAVLLFLSSFIVQLFIIATGGIYSPFLILIHMYILAASFFFPFYVPSLFLLFTFIVVALQLNQNPELLSQVVTEPGTAILYLLTFIAIVPLARVLSLRYHLKTASSTELVNQLKIEEPILSELSEMVLVTDKNFTVLSLNDAVEETLQQSRSEILQHSIFDHVLLRDAAGKVITTETIQTRQLKDDTEFSDLSLFTKKGVLKVSMEIKIIEELEGDSGQISFIINPGMRPAMRTDSTLVEQAITKHEALFAEFKNRLQDKDLRKRISLVMKAEHDIRKMYELDSLSPEAGKVSIDIAHLAKEIITKESEFAGSFGVTADFGFVNFGEKDIAPLVTDVMPVSPDDLTGPFFTVNCNVKYLGYVLQRIVDIAVLLASQEGDKTVRLTIERSETDILIHIITQVSSFNQSELTELFIPYYGRLATRTNLKLGSGLEGYLVKAICERLQIPLTTQLRHEDASIVFTLQIKKNTASLSSSMILQQGKETQST